MPIRKGPSQIAYGYLSPQKIMFPDPIVQPRDPSDNDQGEIGQTWTNSVDESYFFLASITTGIYNWIPISINGGGGSFTRIDLNVTDADGNGVIYIGGFRFMSAYGIENTFLGTNSGNLTNTGSGNVGVGNNAARALTSGDYNTVVGDEAGSAITTGEYNTTIGDSSLDALTTGNANTSLGAGALGSLVTGSNNIAIGLSAGQAYTTAQSSNICIGNAGDVLDGGAIRIGTYGLGVGQQTVAYIAGDVFASAGIFASGDTGAGFAGTTGVTNVVNTTQGVGNLSILSTNGNAGDNAGFIKAYVGGTPVWIPYFDDIAP